VQTFAGFGEIALDRYRQPTGALGGTTELLGLSRDGQNRCQYANDLKWSARPPQASPHCIPPNGGPYAYATHTHRGRSRPATSHTAIAALANWTRYYCHTCPARTFGKDRQALGRLYDSGTMIPWRRKPNSALWLPALIQIAADPRVAGAAAYIVPARLWTAASSA
jgi:hypothetical protein